MDPLVQKINDLITEVATEFNFDRIKRGDPATLTTTAKTLVGALNELKTGLDGIGGVLIKDAVTGATTTWSSSKIQGTVDAAVAALIGGAPGTLDTLKELADQLASDQGVINGILSALALRVRVDAAQAFTPAQQGQGRANIGAAAAADIGDVPTADFVTAFRNALA